MMQQTSSTILCFAIVSLLVTDTGWRRNDGCGR